MFFLIPFFKFRFLCCRTHFTTHTLSMHTPTLFLQNPLYHSGIENNLDHVATLEVDEAEEEIRILFR